MSDANRVRVSYIAEATFGVTPSGNLQEVRITGESLAQNTTTVTSAELRTDRQIPAVKRTDINAQGGFNIELSYGAHDDLMMYALMASSWAAAVTLGPGITYSMQNSDNSINDSATGFVSAGFDAGSWIYITGFTEAANNGFFKIVSVVAGKMVLSGGTVTDESAGDSVTIVQGAEITNGTTLKSLSIEKEFADLSNTFAAYRGMCIDGFTLSVAAGQLVTGGFTFMGKEETSETATIGTGYTAAATNDVMNAVDDVFAILEGQSSTSATSFTLSLANNLRARTQIATLGAISVGVGKINLTGTLQAYFETATMFNKYLNNTATSLAFIFDDTDGNYYVIDVPQVRFATGQRVAGGQDTDIIADLTWEGYMDPDETKTFRIQRWPAS